MRRQSNAGCRGGMERVAGPLPSCIVFSLFGGGGEGQLRRSRCTMACLRSDGGMSGCAFPHCLHLLIVAQPLTTLFSHWSAISILLVVILPVSFDLQQRCDVLVSFVVRALPHPYARADEPPADVRSDARQRQRRTPRSLCLVWAIWGNLRSWCVA